METITLNEEGTVTVQTVTEQIVALADYVERAQREMEDIDREITQRQARKQAILDKFQQLLTSLQEKQFIGQ
jgi:UPF0288 family protein (methanogenesis marker protein 3)